MGADAAQHNTHVCRFKRSDAAALACLQAAEAAEDVHQLVGAAAAQLKALKAGAAALSAAAAPLADALDAGMRPLATSSGYAQACHLSVSSQILQLCQLDLVQHSSGCLLHRCGRLAPFFSCKQVHGLSCVVSVVCAGSSRRRQQASERRALCRGGPCGRCQPAASCSRGTGGVMLFTAAVSEPIVRPAVSPACSSF